MDGTKTERWCFKGPNIGGTSMFFQSNSCCNNMNYIELHIYIYIYTYIHTYIIYNCIYIYICILYVYTYTYYIQPYVI